MHRHSPVVVLLLVFFDHVQNASLNSNRLLLVSLVQCNKNITIIRNITFPSKQIFQSCDLNCCTKATFNRSQVCQITSQTTSGMCLGRFCYSGECAEYDIHPSTTVEIYWPLWIDRSYLPIRYSILILLLIVNVFLTLLLLIFVIRSIRKAQTIAARKLRRYSLF